MSLFLRMSSVQCVMSDGGTSATPNGSNKARMPTQVTLRRFYRPEDISRDAAYGAAFTDVYESEETLAVPLDTVVSKCSVLPPGETITGAAQGAWALRINLRDN